jgi:pyruvate kinase
MQKSTKIVATIGPATETEEIIKEMISAGMNVARFNTKHGTPEWHKERMARVKKVAKEMGVAVGILLDLQGPEIRITLPSDETFNVKIGDKVTFTANSESEDPKTPIIPQIVVDTLKVGDHISIDDGIGEFEIVEEHYDSIVAISKGNFEVKQRKTLNTPGIIIDLPSLIPADLVQLDNADNGQVDFVGLSFVRNKEDVAILRNELDSRGLVADIVAKIENQSAIEKFDEILEVSDAIMVARGDLAVEVPFEELTYWQKELIRKSREKGKPVITATQMLKSMVDNPLPTRAEVSDVANAIYDGTDAVMLSEETTIGNYPVKSISVQTKIAKYNEQFAQPVSIRTHDSDESAYITHSAISLLEISNLETNEIEIDKLICLTETGQTARNIARFRPNVPVFALTSNEQTYRKMSLIYGINPFVINLGEGEKLESSAVLLDKIVELGIARTGENILLVHGTFWKKPGLTNTLSILKIP